MHGSRKARPRIPRLQETALRAAGVQRLFTEQASGGRWDRPQLQRLLDQLRSADVVVVWKLDRLSRSLKDLLHIMDRIAQAEAGFRSLTEAIDTTTPAGRMLMQMVGSFAEFERAMIRERTQAGLAIARAEGRTRGRRPKLGPQQQAAIVEMVRSGRQTQAAAARLFRVHPATVSRLVAMQQQVEPTAVHTPGGRVNASVHTARGVSVRQPYEAGQTGDAQRAKTRGHSIRQFTVTPTRDRGKANHRASFLAMEPRWGDGVHAPWHPGASCRCPFLGPILPRIAHYVDNNSTPTIAPTLLQEKAFLFLHTSCQGAQRSVPLLCATIGPTSSSYVRQSLVSTTMPPRYPAVVVAPAEACDAKKSANARRAIMPRLALRPVCRSSRSR